MEAQCNTQRVKREKLGARVEIVRRGLGRIDFSYQAVEFGGSVAYFCQQRLDPMYYIVEKAINPFQMKLMLCFDT